MTEFIIKKMQKAEVQIALNWAQKEGWNPGLGDAACFYQADPEGFFVGLLNGEVIAVGAAVIYSDYFAFCGLYIVKPEFRNQGYGLQLTHARLNYVGNRITGIDGVLENVSKYEKIGYKTSHQQIRYELISYPTFRHAPSVVDVRIIPLQMLEDFDRHYFPANRHAFLKCWIAQPNSFSLVHYEGGKILGYGVIRKCFLGYKIAPLFASNPEIAKALFESLCSKITEGPVYLDVPESNVHALGLVKYYNMAPKFHVMRMYRNGFPKISFPEGIYGVTSFELG